jgi:Reductase C-terminal
MLGERQSWRTVSYIFSSVFDVTFNVVGSTEKADERVVRGSLKDKSFSVLYIEDKRLRGAFLLDQSLVEAKAAGALIANRSDISATKTKLSDTGFPLNRAAVQTVIVLQGGGALGAFECGVVKALEERNTMQTLSPVSRLARSTLQSSLPIPVRQRTRLKPSGAS